MKSFKLKIAELDKELFSGEVVSVTLPAQTGEMTVLANHMPTIAKLKPGFIKIRANKDKEPLEIELEKGGVMEVSDNRVNVLVF